MSEHPELTLFGDDRSDASPEIDEAAFDRATEHSLDDHSSITLVPGLVRGHLRVREQLAAVPGWERRSRWMFDRRVAEPRLTNEYRNLVGAHPVVLDLAAALSRYCGVPYDGVWMNWYRDHADGTGWHADRPANAASTAVVPVVTLGATRRFLIRPAGGGPSTAFLPAGGDVLIMRGRCQRDWQHCVPKQRAQAGGRISLNFTSTRQAAH